MPVNEPEQPSLEGMPPAEEEAPHMIARVTALAMKIVYPFIAKNDIRYYLNGANIRPLDDGGVMIVATDGHRYVVVRDVDGYADKELIVEVSKDGLKHAVKGHTFDVMSNGRAMIVDVAAQPLFIQPNNSLIVGDFPRVENVASVIGYKEGIHGAVNPSYLADAVAIGEFFQGIRFFSRDEDHPLQFVCDGIAGIDCFGGVMIMRDTALALPSWFPERAATISLASV